MTEIGYGCVVARKFSNDASVSFQINFAMDATADDINAKLDTLAAILDRQQDRIDVPTLRRQIEQQEVQLQTQAEQIAELREKIDAPADPLKRTNNVEPLRQSYNNALVTYKTMQGNIARAKQALAELEKKAA